MKNIEKYEEEIKKEIANFRDIPCIVKDLKDGGCGESRNCVTCSTEMLHWLSQEYEEPSILTNKEKIIIKNILKAFEPFGKEVSYITKEYWDYGVNCCFLNFKYGDDNFGTLTFNQNKLFKGMEINKCYTLGGLGLCLINLQD